MTLNWLQSYPPQVSPNIDYQNETLQNLFYDAVRQFPNQPAYRFLGTQLTYQEFARLAEQFASFCQSSLKLQKGDRIAVMLPNTLQYPICIFGALLAGLTIVNLNPLDKAPSLKNELTDSNAKLIVVLENFVSELELIIAETQVQQVVITSIGFAQPWWKCKLINFYLRHIKKIVPRWHLPGSMRFSKALQQGASVPFKRVLVTPDDLAFLQYTSGTTGVPKGVMLSHKNLMCNVLQCLSWVRDKVQDGKEVVLTALPLYHVFSLTVNALVFMKLGGESVLILDPRNLPQLISTMRSTKFTCITGVNTLFKVLLEQRKFHKLDFSKLKLTIGGGMAVQKDVALTWEQVTHCLLLQGYGLTEASPVVTITPTNLTEFNGSIGLPVPSTLVAIRTPEGRDLPIGEVGELCIKGPQVMQGYWHKLEATEAVLSKDGWLRTGDAAYMDAEGFIYIVDRLKDMIIVSGFNVYPAEVENMLKTLPQVDEVAVIGIPNSLHGEVVKAFIVKAKNSQLTTVEVKDFCRRNLTAYKCPHEIVFIDSLPKNAMGKVLKKELKRLSPPQSLKVNSSVIPPKTNKRLRKA